MKITTAPKLLGILLFFTVGMSSLCSQDVIADTTFFNQKCVLYQKWLNRTGLGEFLSIKAITAEPNEQLTMFLEFPIENTDSVTALWQEIKLNFEKSNHISLEQELFYRMVNLLEIDQTFAKIQLFDTYDPFIDPCFYIGIFFQEGQVNIESSSCKADIATVQFDPSDFWNIQSRTGSSIALSDTEAKVQELKEQFPRDAVFNLILKEAKRAYEKDYSLTECTKRYPKVHLDEKSNTVLRFHVTDLCREVLVDETNSWLCAWLSSFFSKDCNWITREKLDFIFFYEETTFGFKIHGKIYGYFGSGYFDELNRGAYISMEEDPRFQPYLEDYAKQISSEIHEIILNEYQNKKKTKARN